MYDFFLGNYGLDWAAAIFMFLSIWRLGDHKRDGFIHAAMASVFWIAFNVHVHSAAGIVANIVILAMSVRSFRKSRKPSPSDEPGQAAKNGPE